MHEPITEFPKGTVIGSLRLAKDNQVVDVTRLKYGSRTRFVEKVTTKNKHGTFVTAFRKTDDFPSDKIANRYISEWIDGIVNNREFRVLHKDPAFDTADNVAAKKLA